MKGNRANLDGSYVRQNGKIFPWGMIRIYSEHVLDDLGDDHGGLAVWSPDLLDYGSERYCAKIDHGSVLVFEKETDKHVKTIGKKSLFSTANVSIKKVVDMGYLQWVGELGLSDDNGDDWKPWLDALRKVSRGEPPSILDESAFVKVSEELIGKKLIALNFGNGTDPDYRIFTFEGKAIEFKVTYPLSRKKQ